MSKTSKLQVYAPMSADLFHASHVTLLEHAAIHGQVLVGLNSDEVILQKKGKLPSVGFDDRKRVLDAISLVSGVCKVEDYLEELENHSHMTIVHGDDWTKSFSKRVAGMCKKNGGKLVLIPYSEGLSSSGIKSRIISSLNQSALPETDAREVNKRVKEELSSLVDDDHYYHSRSVGTPVSFAKDGGEPELFVVFEFDGLKMLWMNHAKSDGRNVGPVIYTVMDGDYVNSTKISRFLSGLSYLCSSQFTSSEKMTFGSSLPTMNGTYSLIQRGLIMPIEFSMHFEHIASLDGDTKRALAYLRMYRDGFASAYTRYLALHQVGECLGLALKKENYMARSSSAHTKPRHSKKDNPESDPDDANTFSHVSRAETELLDTVKKELLERVQKKVWPKPQRGLSI